MSTNKDGGQAFPHGNPEQGGSEGMTLRDYFAGQALAGNFACQTLQWPINDYLAAARSSYKAADAMLEARKEKWP